MEAMVWLIWTLLFGSHLLYNDSIKIRICNSSCFLASKYIHILVYNKLCLLLLFVHTHSHNVRKHTFGHKLKKEGPSLAEHDMPCLSKQCRFRSVGF